MGKKVTTEANLLQAVDRLFSNKAIHTNGALTQDNAAREAGVTRTTFNRYPKALDYFRKKKTDSEYVPACPLTLENEIGGLKRQISELQKNSVQQKKDTKLALDAARDEIYVLNTVLEKRNKTIEARDRDIAELKNRLKEQRR